jgi:hypothetical protein
MIVKDFRLISGKSFTKRKPFVIMMSARRYGGHQASRGHHASLNFPALALSPADGTDGAPRARQRRRHAAVDGFPGTPSP